MSNFYLKIVTTIVTKNNYSSKKAIKITKNSTIPEINKEQFI